jgi:mannose-6-phosphate isomerase-like protein (cupin superfamily)
LRDAASLEDLRDGSWVTAAGNVNLDRHAGLDNTTPRHVVLILMDPMKSIATSRHRRKAFSVLASTRNSQAATMTLVPGGESQEASANEHAWAEQWLYVVSGTGSARVGKRTIRLREGSLVLIEKREPHQIRAGKRSRLVTVNIYVPPAYDHNGEPLRES